ncbi:hypothetical protein [Pectobacterium carotovorum]|uniref:hypothetical protein n=1 Tax=Pectobacterium carotovorum TaxID=554 RepID=UPI0005026553|nr:hypothetical protein [Pectobacterium carotovorum]KFW97759.1 hypothetical protein JV33_20675 [Pectobacterium carotovorum subsp. carotovorum]KML64968.1 hypothetical protein G032_21145 [Pectobacterium carotovorum subsp. carotovorum ICMP 5702]SHH69004.1 hypothetical protein SAMN05444147_11648 [Pectobacterium carotovorum]
MKRFFLFALTIIATLMISGCEDKGQGFIGSWGQVSGDKYPAHISIKYDDGVYHVDVNSLDVVAVQKKQEKAFTDYMLGKVKEKPSKDLDLSDCYKSISLEAKALNDSTLQGDGFSMRMENGKVKYNGELFAKK